MPSRPPRPRTGRGDALDRDRVVDAAMMLADATGIGAVTMRAMAAELGVEAMSLYHHVRNKQEVLAGMSDRVIAAMVLPDGTHWKLSLRTAAISAHAVLLSHPWAAPLLLSGVRVSPARLRQMNWMLGTLRHAGCSARLTDRAYHSLDSHLMGSALFATRIDTALDELPGSLQEFLDGLAGQKLPHLVEHIRAHQRPEDPDGEGTFVFGLDLILDGIEQALRHEPTQPDPAAHVIQHDAVNGRPPHDRRT